ncbi:uncharacterized protein LOC141815975 [Curcuma longa]|uniref:uncharacterized protein LOC141815975 n=1 Tax=Curcuma longa TaxID=136217 RepID=UPI003D9DE388
MSKEANKFLKIQACVLKVNNICCDGCQKKVRRVLLRTEGVYEVTIDEEKRKVTVTGTADPATLIRKLNKAGKHAELWPAKGGQQKLTNMLQELKLGHAKGQQKSGGGGIKEQKSQKQTQELGKGFKDLKFPDLKLPFKKDDNRKVKFNLPSKEEMDDGSDYSDDDDDGEEFDDEDLDDMHDEFGGDGMLGGPKMMNPNLKNFNQFNGKGNNTASHKKGGGGGGGKGANLVQVINKAMRGKNGGDGKQNQASGGKKKGHGTHENKNGGGSNKSAKGGNQGNHGYPSSHGANKHVDGNNNKGFPASSMPPDYFQPGMMPPEMMMMAGGNPYQQQQYLQALMQQQQQQQRMMMSGAERPAFSSAQLGYGYGRPVYVPQPYPHEVPYSMFSDENPNSCSVM